MTTDLVLLDAPAALPTARPDAPSLDLMGLILAGLKPTSVAGYVKDFEAFRLFTGAPSAEAALQSLFRLDTGPAAALVLAYQSAMLDRELSPATIARRVAALARAVKRARMVGLTRLTLETEAAGRPEAFRDVRGPGAAGWRKLLDRAEAEAADGTARTARNLAVLLLLHDRALRRGEVVGIDFPENLDMTRPAVAILGKGKRAKEWLTINPQTRDAIGRYLTLRGDWPGPLFIRTDRRGPELASPGDGAPEPAAAPIGTARLDGESVNRMVQALARRAGVGRIVRAHGLRHSAITEALDSGFDVRDVKGFSRHSRIDTVLIYDDRRKDVGGDITRALGRRREPRKRAGKRTLPGAE